MLGPKHITKIRQEFIRINHKLARFQHQVNNIYEELHQIAKEIEESLENPKHYPAACLIDPLLRRAQKVLDKLPTDMPQGCLPLRQQAILSKVIAFRKSPRRLREAAVKAFTEAELEKCSDFFDTIESNPLTPEQRLAVITDEDATLVRAGAGSGKTSVIVAKAAYLIKKRGISESNILLLSFNDSVAEQMSSRIEKRIGAPVNAMTFHGLGYDSIIGKVEKSKPALAAHAKDPGQFRALL